MNRRALLCCLFVLVAAPSGGCGGGGPNIRLSVGSGPTPVTNYEDVSSAIDGTFEGWDGDTVFELQNGQVWQQSSYSYRYHYAYNPDVLIYDDNGEWKLKVDGVDEVITVQRLR